MSSSSSPREQRSVRLHPSSPSRSQTVTAMMGGGGGSRVRKTTHILGGGGKIKASPPPRSPSTSSPQRRRRRLTTTPRTTTIIIASPKRHTSPTVFTVPTTVSPTAVASTTHHIIMQPNNNTPPPSSLPTTSGGSVRYYTTLKKAIEFISECIENDEPQRLFDSILHEETGFDDGFERWKRFSFPPLRAQFNIMDFRKRYINRKFPTKKDGGDTLTLGGHDKELGHVHIVFARVVVGGRRGGWAIVRIFRCR